jgi:uncharacterized membrane protein YbhN (UPF0104 family)
VNRRWLRLLLGVVLGGGALWLATRAVDWAETGRALRSADISLLLAALLVQAASFLIVALRWRALFPTPGTVSVSRLVQVLLVAQLVNAAFPLRLGPVARAYLVGERDGQGTALALTTVAGEKLLEMLALALGIVLLLVLLPLPAWLRHAGLGAVLFAAGGLAAVLLVTGVSLAMLDTMAAWLSPGRIGQLLGWTAILWAAGTGVNALVLLAFGLPAHSTTAIALLILLQLGARVPGAPANAGVFESLCIAGLGWFGVEPAQALSYGLALHAVVLLPGLVGGAWVLWRDSAVRAGLRQAANATASRTPGGQL